MPVKKGTNKADFKWSATGKEGGDCPEGYDVAAAVCRFVNPQGKVSDEQGGSPGRGAGGCGGVIACCLLRSRAAHDLHQH